MTKRTTKSFYCDKCFFYTKRKSHWERHILTPKHNFNASDTKNDKLVVVHKEHVCECGHVYKYSSGLGKHKKTCVFLLKKDIEEHKKEYDNKLNQIIELQKPNVINNKVSINFYLNNICKNAINLTEFINNLKISFDDLTYTTNYGYVKGISNIFVKQLKDMEPTQRPIHCSDNKRLKFYIKDDDQWNKDDGHEKIDKSIDDLTHKQVKMIKMWEKNNPHYKTSTSLLLEWHKMVQEVIGGLDNEKKQIKRNIGSTLKMDNLFA
jgi:hypothetical protein